MGDLIYLAEKKKPEERENLTLTQMIEKISQEKSFIEKTMLKKKGPFSIGDFKKILKVRISQLVLEHRKMERETFLCSSYVAELLTEMIHPERIESWSGIDHLIRYEKEGSKVLLKKGADICFFYYTYFLDKNIPQLQMTRDIGSRLYFLLYYAESSAISFYMGKNFPFMGKIAHRSLKDF